MYKKVLFVILTLLFIGGCGSNSINSNNKLISKKYNIREGNFSESGVN